MIRPAASALVLVILLSAAGSGSALATDPTGLPPLPADLNRPSVQAEMAAANAGSEVAWEPGGTPAPLIPADGGATLSSEAVAPLAVGPGGGLPNGLTREVLGFLPYWMLSDPGVTSTLRFDLLSTIAYFDVTLNSDGSIIRSGAGWGGWNSAAMTQVMNAAHARGVKVVLTASMHGWNAVDAARMPAMLNSASNRARAVADIVAVVKGRNADGVNVDFEPVPTELRAQFTAFVRELKAGLVSAGAGSYLTVDTMAGAASWATGYDVRGLTADGAADALMVMAYDLSWNGSARAGGVAPIDSPYIFDVNDALRAHLAAGVPAAKMIWGVPYYGRTWATTSDALNATTRAGPSYAYHYTDAIQHAAQYGRRWDPAGQVPWYAWYSAGWWQGYYDDAQSLGAKYDLVNRNNLAGIGIWALGMDAGRGELWSVIGGKFGRSSARLGGPDRYATAAAVSAYNFAPGVPVAYVATGANFPDALAAGPAAALQRGPVLLVQVNRVTAPTVAELIRLRPQRIVVLGSAGVVSDGVKDALQQFTTGSVTRIAGPDRYATAAAISAAHFATAPVVYLATGENYPDALAGGAAAGMERGPILLVRSDAIPGPTQAELERLRPAKIVVLGSSGVVSDSVLAAARAWSPAVTRVAGADRYASAVAVSRSLFPGESLAVYIATGTAFPDGLAAAPVAAIGRAPLLLVRGNILPAIVLEELRRLKPQQIVIIGGPGAISDAMMSGIVGY